MVKSFGFQQKGDRNSRGLINLLKVTQAAGDTGEIKPVVLGDASQQWTYYVLIAFGV